MTYSDRVKETVENIKTEAEELQYQVAEAKEALENLQSDFEELMDMAQDMGVI